MSYRSRLAALNHSLSLAKPSRARIILLTGQSSFVSSRLTPAQVDFLQSIAPPSVEPLLMGFPYHSEFDCPAPAAGLVAASARNGLQFWWSVLSPVYRRSVACALHTVLRNTAESLYIVTGSCGLQILASAWPLLTVPDGLRLRVVAVGPAMLRAGSFPANRIRVLRGSRDFWCRLFYRGRLDAYCNSGHMDYWESPDVRRLVARLLREDTEAS